MTMDTALNRTLRALAHPCRTADLNSQAQSDIGPLDRHQERKGDDPWLMHGEHFGTLYSGRCRFPPVPRRNYR